ncbi:spore coat U domain-containing protein [Acinetobacter sp. ME22]|uniref:Csu type fimbrial protein n=1 Tax=Acinetobacter sp. ME22 TaxID=2904802 RepID=UPI001EDBB396|nr:spore coat protein U domain-containing protein [Acinetobacter sp. ME22]MCG2574445.1 spore coat U domain-containing protein [Acinetobacter sp. ME22]
MKKSLKLSALLLSTAVATLGFSGVTNAAGTLSGQIGVTLTIGTGCSIANSSTTATNTWGSLDFGSYADLRNTIDGSVMGTGGTSGLQVTCTNGLAYSLSLDGGLNEDTNSLRNVFDTASSTAVPYRLYSDATRSTEIASGGTLSFTGTGNLVSIPIYGRILPSDQSQVAPTQGTYVDTITATVMW